MIEDFSKNGEAEEDIRIHFHEEQLNSARIRVIGVGGGGGNAVNRMIESHLEGVEFVVANTDLQALKGSNAPVKIQLGVKLTNGLGAGANPEVGRKAALEDADKIIEALEGADMVFITTGLGGGTGTGAAPIIASLASEMGALTVAVVTKPFAFEGKRRQNQAERGLQELIDSVDTTVVIPNEKLLAVAKDAGFFESFRVADDILRQAVQGISDIITIPGIINRDFADVKTIMAGMGYAVMGTATAKGDGRATRAAQAAIASPLLEAGAIDGARGILINITGSSSLRLAEVNEASTIIQSAAHEDANIIFGAVLDEKMKDEVKITVIATGFKGTPRRREHANPAADVVHNVRAAAASVHATYEVPSVSQSGSPSRGASLRDGVKEPTTTSRSTVQRGDGSTSASGGIFPTDNVESPGSVGVNPEPIMTAYPEAYRAADSPSAISYVPEEYGDAERPPSITHISEDYRDGDSPASAASISEDHRAADGAPSISYIPDDLEDLSEVVRHAEPKMKDEQPVPIETVSSSPDISYNADDLEVPAFMRKRGQS